MEFIHRHRAGVLMFILSVFSLLCLSLRLSAAVTGVKTAVWFLISPQVVYSGEFFNRLDSASGSFFRLAHAEAENYILHEENLRLSKKEAERDALEEENIRLRRLLALQQKSFSDGIPAEVIGSDVRDWFRSFIVNKGSDDHVEVASAVMALRDGHTQLIGRVVEVKPTTSKVLLVTDALSAIAVTLSHGGDMGLLEGQNRPWMYLNYLTQRADVAPGDTVTTAGLGGVFPPGIPVGEVISVSNSPDGFFKRAKIVPLVDPNSIQEVLLVNRQDTNVEKKK